MTLLKTTSMRALPISPALDPLLKTKVDSVILIQRERELAAVKTVGLLLLAALTFSTALLLGSFWGHFAFEANPSAIKVIIATLLVMMTLTFFNHRYAQALRHSSPLPYERSAFGFERKIAKDFLEL